jgi:hypothetical protein
MIMKKEVLSLLWFFSSFWAETSPLKRSLHSFRSLEQECQEKMMKPKKRSHFHPIFLWISRVYCLLCCSVIRRWCRKILASSSSSCFWSTKDNLTGVVARPLSQGRQKEDLMWEKWTQ